MAGAQRRARVLAYLGIHGPGVDRLCAACVAYLPSVGGASLAVMTNLPASGPVHATDPVAMRVEELQGTLGEGPCVDAYQAGQPVIAPDLDSDPYLRRWPAFTPGAVSAGVQAIFAFPLQIGAIRIGVLDL